MLRLHIRINCKRVYRHVELTSPLGRILEKHELYYASGVASRKFAKSTPLQTAKELKGIKALELILA